jgi:enamine deaminase RidA (YjgF/YER057c/UK114 family)
MDFMVRILYYEVSSLGHAFGGGPERAPPMLTPYNPPGQAWPGISQAVAIKSAGVLVTSGITALDEAGNVVEGDFEAQVVAVYRNIEQVLKAASLGFDSIARITTYVTGYDPSMIPVIRKVRGRYLSQSCPPASVVIGVAALYDPRLKIEVEIVAAIP